jgi:DNA polymerase III epsilon subunit-like protein
MFTYDVGWAVVDKRGKVYRTKSYVVNEIFNKEQELMKSSYYANKIPKYKAEIATGQRIVASFYEIRKDLKEDMEEFGITEVYAHNMRFDYGTLNNTQRWLTKSKFRYFFPYGTEICDTLKMARQVIGKMPTYQRFCEENGYITKNNQLRFTAEIIYRFITRNNDFTECHTGLEDVMIEKEILAYCFKQHKPMVRQLWA